MLTVYLLSQGGRSRSFQMPCRLAGCAPGPRGGDQQVAAVLEVERDQVRVRRLVGPGQAIQRGQVGRLASCPGPAHAAKQGAMVGQVRGAQLGVGTLRHAIHASRQRAPDRRRGHANGRGWWRRPGRGSGCRVGHDERVVLLGRCAALDLHRQPGLKVDAVRLDSAGEHQFGLRLSRPCAPSRAGN